MPEDVATEQPDAKIQKLLAKLNKDECNRLIGANSPEYRAIAEAAMSWWAMLFVGLQGLGLPKTARAEKLIASSMIVLGTIIQHVYALGIRRGARRRRKR